MVFLSPLADWLEHEWEKKTKNRGPRALGSLVEALDELVHHYEAKLDRDQKKQVSTCVRQLRRRVSHVRNSLNSLGSGSDSSGSDESDSGSDGDGAPLGERKKRKKKKAKNFSNTQQAMMKTAIRDALGDDYGGRPSGVGSASAVVASLDEGLGREDGKKTAGSGGKGDGETASLKLEEADGDGDGAGGAADRDPTVGVSYVDAPTPGPSRAPPKRGNMRANSINLISSGMDRLGLASKSRVAGASGAARSRPGGLLSRSPSVENRASGSVFDEVARSLERAPVEAITGGSPLLGDRASADRSSAERTRHSITEVNEDDGEAPAPTPAPAPASARASHSDSVDLEEAEKIFSLDA